MADSTEQDELGEESLNELVEATYGDDPEKPHRSQEVDSPRHSTELDRIAQDALLTDLDVDAQLDDDIEKGLNRALGSSSSEADSEEELDDGRIKTPPKLASTQWPDRDVSQDEQTRLEATKRANGQAEAVKLSVVANRVESGSSTDLTTLRRRSSPEVAEPQRIRTFEIERFCNVRAFGYACIQLALLANNFVLLRAVVQEGSRYRSVLLGVLWSSVLANAAIGLLIVIQILAPMRKTSTGVPASEWSFFSPKTWQTREESMIHWQRKINYVVTVLSFLSAVLNISVTAFAPVEFSI